MQKKRKRRRRPRTAGPKLSGVILFRCTKEERLEFRRAAAIAKKTLSAYMLDLFRTAEQNARDFAAMRVRLDNLEKETKEQEAEAAKTHERHSKWESEQK